MSLIESAAGLGRVDRRRVWLRWVDDLVERSMAGWGLTCLGLGLALVLGSGCQAPPSTPLSQEDTKPYSEISLAEGDTIKITFPGAPNLNSIQQVRRDGRITLENVGEVVAVGKSPAELEKDLLKLYESQLVTKQVMVTVESSAYTVYVSGAVLRPGKILVTRPISVLEAIMEAGGFDDTRARASSVTVIRQQDGKQRHYRLNVQQMLDGRSDVTFYLHPQDIVHVPTRPL